MTLRVLFYAVAALSIALAMPAFAGDGHDLIRPIAAAIVLGTMAITIVAVAIYIAFPKRWKDGEP